METAKKRFVLVFFVLVSCVGCDQVTKSVAKSFLADGGVWSILGDSVRLQVAHNSGSFLSFGTWLPEVWRQAFFMGGVGVLVLGMLGYALLSKHSRPLGILAMALLVAGGVGNLVDRFAYGGNVVDFINVGIGSLRTGIFNVADICITFGVLILVTGEFTRGMKGSRP